MATRIDARKRYAMAALGCLTVALHILLPPSRLLLRSPVGLAGLNRAAFHLSESRAMNRFPDLQPRVVDLLKVWHQSWWNDARAVMNPYRWQKEVEEAILPLSIVLESLDKQPAVVVDVGAGKGFFSKLLSHLGTKSALQKLCLLDWNYGKRSKKRNPINIASLELANETANIPLELWSASLYDRQVADRMRTLRSTHGRVILVGIHLCKQLAPRAVQLYNCCCDELILAPCCMPSVNTSPWRFGLAQGQIIDPKEVWAAPSPFAKWTRQLAQSMEGQVTVTRVPFAHGANPRNAFIHGRRRSSVVS